MNALKKRSCALDIIRICAFLSVVSVHFFLNCDFYYTPVIGWEMFAMTVIRTFFMICVPLFLILTGFLMGKKKLEKGYYPKIAKTLFVYIAASILCALYKKFYLGHDMGFAKGFAGILNYTSASYAWYIEMYIGLFLLIPFLNGAYSSLDNKKKKLILIFTLVFLTSLPSVINIYKFNSLSFWKTPSTEWQYTKIIPSWWQNIYPITYYFIGCYIKEFGIRLNKWLNLILIPIFALLFGAFNFYRSYNSTFISGPWQDWGALPNVIMTFLVFVFLLNFKLEKAPLFVKKGLNIISDACLGAYLLSYIFDQHFYPVLNEKIPLVTDRINYFIPVVITVAICSLALSLLIDAVYKLILISVRKIKTK